MANLLRATLTCLHLRCRGHRASCCTRRRRRVPSLSVAPPARPPTCKGEMHWIVQTDRSLSLSPPPHFLPTSAARCLHAGSPKLSAGSRCLAIGVAVATRHRCSHAVTGASACDHGTLCVMCVPFSYSHTASQGQPSACHPHFLLALALSWPPHRASCCTRRPT
jgi:hypothetical protein